MDKFDVVIIGGGLGGLSCGAILSKEGLSVCILEQQKHIGGCLQSFKRKGYSLDTGMHYVGSLSEGDTMYQYFKYFGILDKIRYQKLDTDGFDVINLGKGKEYSHAIGYDRFIDTLSQSFPEEREAISEYVSILQRIGKNIKPDILKKGHISSGGEEYMGISAYQTIDKLFKSDLLKNVIAGNIPLYGYDKNKSSLYEHGMIHNSNIEGAYRFVGNTQHVADAFCDVIKANGGQVICDSEVTGIDVEGGKINSVEINNETIIETKNVISAIHPVLTMSLLRNNTVIKKAFMTRVNSLENSFGLFTTYLLLKPNTFKYINRNYYLYNSPDVWNKFADYKSCNIPVILFSCQNNGDSEYASVITLMTPMDFSSLSKWEGSKVGQRPAEYIEFKERYTNAMIEFVSKYFHGLKSCIQYIYSTTPLSYKDYNSMPQGSAYGIIKDFNNPMITHLSQRTKINNLYLTGQNLNVHGCLGTTVSAAVTCSEIIGKEYLAKKIGNE